MWLHEAVVVEIEAVHSRATEQSTCSHQSTRGKSRTEYSILLALPAEPRNHPAAATPD